MKWVISAYLVLSTFLSASAAETGELSSQSKALKEAFEKMDQQGAEPFIRTFPKDRREFDEICNSPKFDQLYDCHDIIETGAKKALTTIPVAMGAKLARLASQVHYSADAPNYLQAIWLYFCENQTRDFAQALSKLSLKEQRSALRYLTYGIEADTNAQLDRCIQRLQKEKLMAMAQIGKSVRLKKKMDHH